MGTMYARREGYMNAHGKYIVFLDSDDCLLPGALESLYGAIESTGADIVFSSFVVQTFRGKEKVIHPKLSWEWTASVYKSLLKGEINSGLNSCIFSATLFRACSYKTVENLTYREDYYLLLQIVERMSKVSVIDKPTYYYRKNLASSTHRNRKNQIRQNMFVEREAFSFLKKKLDTKFLIKNTIRIRVIWSMSYILKPREVFPEKELYENISLGALSRLFPFPQSVVLWLRIHLPLWHYYRTAKHMLLLWACKSCQRV